MFLDPKIKARVRNYLAQTSNLHYSEIPECDLNASLPSSPTSTNRSATTASRQQRAILVQQSQDSLCRKSRIPTIIKSPVHVSSKNCPQSPHGQNKSKFSHIPTANGTIPPATTNSPLPQSSAYVGEPKPKQRIEAYMMTGDLILNLSRTPQSSGLITSHSKKVNFILHCCNLINFI